MFLRDLGPVSGGGRGKSERARKNFSKKKILQEKIRPKKSQEQAVKIRIAGFKNLQLGVVFLENYNLVFFFCGKNLSCVF